MSCIRSPSSLDMQSTSLFVTQSKHIHLWKMLCSFCPFLSFPNAHLVYLLGPFVNVHSLFNFNHSRSWEQNLLETVSKIAVSLLMSFKCNHTNQFDAAYDIIVFIASSNVLKVRDHSSLALHSKCSQDRVHLSKWCVWSYRRCVNMNQFQWRFRWMWLRLWSRNVLLKITPSTWWNEDSSSKTILSTFHMSFECVPLWSSLRETFDRFFSIIQCCNKVSCSMIHENGTKSVQRIRVSNYWRKIGFFSTEGKNF